MRFEGKHNLFKDLAHRVKNFKNIPKTMAYHHQELVCCYVNSGSDRSSFVKESRTGPGKCTEPGAHEPPKELDPSKSKKLVLHEFGC